MDDITFFATPRKHDALGLIWETLMESFAQLFEESLKNVETRPGSMVKGTVVAINNGFVIVDTGLKSESPIPQEQFLNARVS